MYSISSDVLKLSILDPKVDREFFGLRFCTGGYIFQIENQNGDFLLSGPTYPGKVVPVHGQGLPETFNHIPLKIKGSEDVVILGIGRCNIERNEIVEIAEWNVIEEESKITFESRYTFDTTDIGLKREVCVSNHTVVSKTTLFNWGTQPIPVSWYAHPFFPPREDNVMCTIHGDFELDKDTGFFERKENLVKRVPNIDSELSFQPVRVNMPLRATVYTSADYEVDIKTDYYSDFAPIWANDNTFSIEPYYDSTVFSSRKLEWSISYDFKLKKQS